MSLTTSFFFINFSMSIIILVMLVIYKIKPNLFSAKTRYYMWIVILIGLLVPIRPFIGSGLISLAAPTGVTYAPLTTGALSWSHIGLMIWGSVAISIFSYHIIQYNRFRRSVKRWGEIKNSGEIWDVLQSTQDKMGLKNKKIRLITCDFITSSMLTGFLRPVILLPEGAFDSEALELIFKHELVHYKRRDLLFKLLSLVAISVHWFNPLVYLMSVAMQAEGETSCDEEVLQNSNLEKRHFYAEMMIRMIGTGRSKTFLSTTFYDGEKGIKKRLKFIMDITNRLPKLSYVPLIIISILTIFSGSIFAYPESSVEKENDVGVGQYEWLGDINYPWGYVREENFTPENNQSVPLLPSDGDQTVLPLPPSGDQAASPLPPSGDQTVSPLPPNDDQTVPPLPPGDDQTVSPLPPNDDQTESNNHPNSPPDGAFDSGEPPLGSIWAERLINLFFVEITIGLNGLEEERHTSESWQAFMEVYERVGRLMGSGIYEEDQQDPNYVLYHQLRAAFEGLIPLEDN